MKRKNILLLLIDCLRADVSISEEKRINTPFIDTLRKKGATYKNAFSVASSTTPAVSSILTGLYPPVHGVVGLMGYKLDKTCKTLPEVLLDNGYNTHAFVTGPLLPETDIDRGFIEYHYRESSQYVYTPFGNDLTSQLSSMTEPWFCLVHLWEVHVPRQVPSKYNTSNMLSHYEKAVSCIDRWLYENLLDKINFQDTIVILTGDHGERDVPFIDNLVVSKNFNRIDRRFHIKRRFMNLRKKYFYNRKKLPLWFAHGYHLYDFLIRIPFIIVANGKVIESSMNSNLISLIDIYPTILEAADIDNPSRINGSSLINNNNSNERSLYLEASNLSTAIDGSLWLKGVRSATWKYIVGVKNKNLKEELYNLEKDPFENNNLAYKDYSARNKMKNILSEIEYEMENHKKVLNGDNRMTDEDIVKMTKVLKNLGYL